MKGFLSVLALPAIILPVLAAPTPAQLALQEKDLPIMQNLYSQIVGPETSFQNTLKSLNGATPSATQISQLEADMKTVIAALQSAKSQLEAANSDSSLRARQSGGSSPGAELLAVLTEIADEVGNGIAAGIAAGGVPFTDLGIFLDQALGALTALGDPLDAANPDSSDEITSVLTQLIGGTTL